MWLWMREIGIISPTGWVGCPTLLKLVTQAGSDDLGFIGWTVTFLKLRGLRLPNQMLWREWRFLVNRSLKNYGSLRIGPGNMTKNLGCPHLPDRSRGEDHRLHLQASRVAVVRHRTVGQEMPLGSLLTPTKKPTYCEMARGTCRKFRPRAESYWWVSGEAIPWNLTASCSRRPTISKEKMHVRRHWEIASTPRWWLWFWAPFSIRWARWMFCALHLPLLIPWSIRMKKKRLWMEMFLKVRMMVESLWLKACRGSWMMRPLVCWMSRNQKLRTQWCTRDSCQDWCTCSYGELSSEGRTSG